MRSGCEASTDFSAYALAYALPYDPTPSSGLGRRDLLSPGAVAQVKFDVNRADKHIIQSIAILDTLDKDINTFAMRVREWYSWHFPELLKIVADNYQYARLVLFIKKRESLTTESLAAIEEITMDATKAQQVLDASKHSMGAPRRLDGRDDPSARPTSPSSRSTDRFTDRSTVRSIAVPTVAQAWRSPRSTCSTSTLLPSASSLWPSTASRCRATCTPRWASSHPTCNRSSATRWPRGSFRTRAA